MPADAKANRGPSAGPANRRALIDAAREVFASEGYGAPLSSIARRAGVGQGSLYRHFPDRISLAVAVFDENIEQLEEFAQSADATLDGLIDRVIEQALASTTLIDLVTADVEDPHVSHLGERVGRVVEIVVAREREAGRLAPGVVADDVFLAISMIAGLVTRMPPAERSTAAARAWALLHPAFAPGSDPEAG